MPRQPRSAVLAYLSRYTHRVAIDRREGAAARRFKDFRWMTRSSWSRRRRVVAKAEWTKDEATPAWSDFGVFWPWGDNHGDMFAFMSRALFACRASRQIIGKPSARQLGPKPRGQRSGLEPDAHGSRSILANRFSNCREFARASAAPRPFARLIKHVKFGLVH
jgi:hypothetical protein